ncbi:CpxP family protein [uncultured Photobacterium sp.]|uniref:CpxP family protein n=1 Tax=uncultured Photobacterium sp. TaxID=173973 RepID=UPI002626A4D9|nr:CpxP family protein [uncultured Photobacterium sp.]
MTKFKKTVLIAIALPFALGSASVLAYGGGHKGGHHGYQDGRGGCGNFDGREMFRDLDLTDEQRDQVRDYRRANRDAMRTEYREHFDSMRGYHQQMQNLMLAENFDENAVRALAKQMSDQQIEHRVAMLQKRHEMLKVLTPAQKEKFKQLQQDRRSHCEGRWADDDQ